MRSALILGMIVLSLGTTARAETWLTATVGSYHLQRGNGYCELNAGIGFEYGNPSLRFVAGTYHNSNCFESNYVGLAYLPLRFSDWRLGSAFLAITGYRRDKKTLRDEPVYAPLPTLTYEGKNFGANILLIPPYDDFKGAVGFQLKVKF